MPVEKRGWLFQEVVLTMRENRDGYVWPAQYPLAGESVVTSDGYPGVVMRSCPGCPPLPHGGMHRYVYFEDETRSPIAYHISQLQPFATATEIN